MLSFITFSMIFQFLYTCKINLLSVFVKSFKLQALPFNSGWQNVDTGTDLAECSHATKISSTTTLLRAFGFPTSECFWPIGSSPNFSTYGITQWSPIYFEK
jgi:hypothetical protein